jgi:SAM-dependent methyltransferase
VGEIFERVLPDAALEWTGERLTTATSGQVEIEHLHRYFLARQLCRGLDVLDVASGEGYGSALLAQTARSVIGVELSDQAVAYSSSAYTAANLRFIQGDARNIPLEDASVDVVVSFEMLEHFFEHDRFIAEVRRVLRPNGLLILSSPDRDVYSPLGSNANPYHARELTRVEFEALLRPAFQHVHVLMQRPMIGSALIADDTAGPSHTLTFEKRGVNHYEVSHGLPRHPYLIAIASDALLPDIANSLFIESSAVGDILNQAAAGPEVRKMAALAEAAHQAARQELASSIAQTREIEKAFQRQLQEAHKTIEAQVARAELAEGEARLTMMKSSAMGAQRDALQRAIRRVGQLEAEARMRVRQLEAEAAEWRQRYFGLRGRLVGILDRFGLMRVARLASPSMRRLIRERILGYGKSS